MLVNNYYHKVIEIHKESSLAAMVYHGENYGSEVVAKNMYSCSHSINSASMLSFVSSTIANVKRKLLQTIRDRKMTFLGQSEEEPTPHNKQETKYV